MSSFVFWLKFQPRFWVSNGNQTPMLIMASPAFVQKLPQLTTKKPLSYSSALHCRCSRNSPGPVESPHKGYVMQKVRPYHDVIMIAQGTTFTYRYGMFSTLRLIGSCEPTHQLVFSRSFGMRRDDAKAVTTARPLLALSSWGTVKISLHVCTSAVWTSGKTIIVDYMGFSM